MQITMFMKEEELLEVIDDKCYENLSGEKEPKLQSIQFITLEGKRIEISNIKEVEIIYRA